MAHPPLVIQLIQEGEQVISALDAAQFNVVAGFWWYSSEENRWKLVIATPLVSTEGPRSTYTKFYNILIDRIGPFKNIGPSDITLVDPRNRVVMSLDDYFLRNRLQLPQHSDTGAHAIVSGRSIEGAYVYRLPHTAYRR